MTELIIKSEREVKLTFHSRVFANDGRLSGYSITAEARGFSASVEVDNSPYGASPDELFAEMSVEWGGWQGIKSWKALEGEYSLSATCDSLGHISLVAELSQNNYPPCWTGSLFLDIDAGSLESLSKNAKAFFNGLAEV